MAAYRGYLRDLSSVILIEWLTNLLRTFCVGACSEYDDVILWDDLRSLTICRIRRSLLTDKDWLGKHLIKPADWRANRF